MGAPNTWRNDLLLNLPMRHRDHDPDAGVSINRGRAGSELDAAFGAGAAEPSKLVDRHGMLFDGGDYLNVGDQSELDFSTEGSILVTLRLLTVPAAGDWDVIAGKQNWATSRNGYLLQFQGTQDNIRFDVATGAAVSAASSTIDLAHFLGKVRTVIGAWDTSGLILYIDGKENGFNATARVATPSGIPYVIGCNNALARFTHMECYNNEACDFALTPSQAAQYDREQREELHLI
jgi:hypothetical protein